MPRSPKSVTFGGDAAFVSATRFPFVAEQVPGSAPWGPTSASFTAQVIANRLANAATYTPTGDLIEVAARASGNKAVLRVRDNGVGIEADLLPQIFDWLVP